MGGRVRAVAVFVVVLLVGAFLGSALSQGTGSPRVSVPAPRVPAGVLPPLFRERVRVEVLNGGGRANMAREATDALRDRGFDVVYFGNAPSFGVAESVVLDRVERLDMARAVADALDIRSVRSEPDQNLYLDVTVVLGEDWEPAAPPPPDSVAEVRAWWDLRHLLERLPWKADEPEGPSPGPGTLVDPRGS